MVKMKQKWADRLHAAGFASQAALARAIETDTGQLNRYVSGVAVPGPFVLDRLCGALGCQPGDLLEYLPDEQQAAG